MRLATVKHPLTVAPVVKDCLTTRGGGYDGGMAQVTYMSLRPVNVMKFQARVKAESVFELLEKYHVTTNSNEFRGHPPETLILSNIRGEAIAGVPGMWNVIIDVQDWENPHEWQAYTPGNFSFLESWKELPAPL